MEHGVCVCARKRSGPPFYRRWACAVDQRLHLEACVLKNKAPGRRSSASCRPADRGVAGLGGNMPTASTHRGTFPRVGDDRGGARACDDVVPVLAALWPVGTWPLREVAVCQPAAWRGEHNAPGMGARPRAPAVDSILKYPTLTEPKSAFLIQLQFLQKAKL
jgi:hypothetical protein